MITHQRVNQALSLLFKGQLAGACEISQQLLLVPNPEAASYFLACEVCVAQSKLTQALEYILLATQKNPSEAQFLLRKAQVQLMLRQGINAQQTATTLAELDNTNPAIQLSAAVIFSQCDNHLGAEKFLLRAQAQKLTSQAFLFEFARNQFYLGKMAQAEQIIAQYLSLYPQNDGTIHLIRAQLSKQSQSQNHVEQLKQLLSGAQTAKEKVNLHYALSKELEDLEDYPNAFDTLYAGAKLQRQRLNYDLGSELSNIENLINTFSVENYKRIADSGLPDSPIFIVGMPRSGTTLVERIIAQHCGILSIGESSDFTLAMSAIINEYIEQHRTENLSPLNAALKINYRDIGQKYLTNVHSMYGQATNTIDKLPFNFLYCGLIKKAFPNARIIHLVRDPLDSCFAVFKTLFNQSYFFSYDLDELSDYYIAYRKLMAHWHNILPGAILDVQYELLVQEPLAVSKQIYEFCGLEWSEETIQIENASTASSTASAAQIRQPIYTSSVHKWRHYQQQLSPVRNKLMDAGLIQESS